MRKKKVAVAMSGGVDSGVAAALVVNAGYQAAGFHLHLWAESAPSEKFSAFSDRRFENKCCSTESLEAARKTAHKLGIPFYIVNFEDVFKKRVVDYFLREYGFGLTPNPCVMCNKFIKFGELLDYTKKLGYDYLATGHYARVVGVPSDQQPATRGNENRSPITGYRLLQGIDKSKDQSYFLYNLTQKQLAQVLFPVGEYQKSEVVKMAKKWQLPVAERPESQEICFFPETDYRPFLKRQIGEKIKPGEVVDARGKVIGKHQGLALYTIGQRHGFTITEKKVIGPLYVIGKDVKKNQLIVGFGQEAERKEFWVKEVNWINERAKRKAQSPKGLRCNVRIRHQGELLKSKVRNLKSKVFVELNEPERGIAPGQAAVFYKDEEVLGGGIIELFQTL